MKTSIASTAAAAEWLQIQTKHKLEISQFRKFRCTVAWTVQL